MPFRAASRNLADWGDVAVQTAGGRMPPEFLRVVRDPALHRHLRPATNCYFEFDASKLDSRPLSSRAQRSWRDDFALALRYRVQQA